MKRIYCVCAALIVLGGCCTTQVDLQISKNEQCAPSKTTAKIGVAFTASTLAQLPITPNEITHAFSRIKEVHLEDTNTFAKWGVLPVVKEHLIRIASEFPEGKPSALTVKAAQDAQQQLVDVLSGLPASAQTEFGTGNSGVVKLGSIGSEHATNVSRFSRTLAAGGYEMALAGYYSRLMQTPQDKSVTDLQTQALAQQINTIDFILKYFTAYFRNGHFFQVSIDSAALLSDGTNAIKAKLAGMGLSADQQSQITQALGALEKQVGNELCKTGPNIAPTQTCLLTQPLGTTAFITRYGSSIQFSGETVTFGENGKLAPQFSQLSSRVIAPQISQVLFEAVFDSIRPFVPAAANSTACVDGLYSPEQCLSDNTSATVKTQVDTVDTDAAKAQSTVTAAAGYLVRLGFWAALNNEAVAQTVETTAGEVARKVTEKLVWINQTSECATKSVHPMVSTVKDY
jgi:hypothetical protein